MPTPFPMRQTATLSPDGPADTKPNTSNPQWRCTDCDKLLGVCRNGHLHLRFARAHEYLVGFPVVATCRGCGTLNRLTAAAPH